MTPSTRPSESLRERFSRRSPPPQATKGGKALRENVRFAMYGEGACPHDAVNEPFSIARVSDHAHELVDVLLHPSRSEGFGMLVLEAQHIGVPVITTRRGAMKDYTMHGADSA